MIKINGLEAEKKERSYRSRRKLSDVPPRKAAVSSGVSFAFKLTKPSTQRLSAQLPKKKKKTERGEGDPGLSTNFQEIGRCVDGGLLWTGGQSSD